MIDEPPPSINAESPARFVWGQWVGCGVAAAGLLVVGWAAATGWGAIVHGHPLYAALLGATLAGSALAGWRTLHPRRRPTRRRPLLQAFLLLTALAWILLVAWLRPFQAVEPALTALRSDAQVTITESATQIVLGPTGAASRTGVFFQPGARVDPRAYAAVLRPLAEAGHVVAIAKPPLGIAFLSQTTFGAVKTDHPHQTRWIVGGHSLGGTVAAMQADAGDSDLAAPVVGLFLYASYPASDLSTSLQAAVLSVSGTRDGLASPDKVAASRDSLPAATTFTPIDGAVHAFFGDYGPQPGDGTPTIDQDQARAQISAATVAFVKDLSRP